jgi:hypothetical protein
MSNDLLDFDICCGRGKGKWNSPGNHRFKELIQNFLPEYADAKSKADKSRIVETVVSLVQEGGGRFVKQDEMNGQWYPISATETRSKVAHAIRDHLATFCKRQLIPTPSQALKANKRRKLASSDEADDAKSPNKHQQRPPQSSDSSSSGSDCTPEPESEPSSRLFQEQNLPLFQQPGNHQQARAVAAGGVANPIQYSMPVPLAGSGFHERFSDTANNSMHINNQFMNAQSLYAQNLLSLRSRQRELLFNTAPSALASRPTSVARIHDDSATLPSRRQQQQPTTRSNTSAGWPSWLPSSATDETTSGGGYLNHYPLHHNHQVVAEDEKLNYNDPLMGPNHQEIANLPQDTAAARSMSLAEARFAFGWSNMEGTVESNQPSGILSQGRGPFAVPLEVPSHPVVPNIAHSNDFQYQQQHGASRMSQQGWDLRRSNNSSNNNNNLELMRIPPVHIQPVPVPPEQGDDEYIADLEPNAVFPPYL